MCVSQGESFTSRCACSSRPEHIRDHQRPQYWRYGTSLHADIWWAWKLISLRFSCTVSSECSLDFALRMFMLHAGYGLLDSETRKCFHTVDQQSWCQDRICHTSRWSTTVHLTRQAIPCASDLSSQHKVPSTSAWISPFLVRGSCG